MASEPQESSVETTTEGHSTRTGSPMAMELMTLVDDIVTAAMMRRFDQVEEIRSGIRLLLVLCVKD